MQGVYLDLETGGLELTHPVIQIAAAYIDAHGAETATFECKVQFDPAVCDPEALKVNHYDPEVWAANAVPERAAARGFAAWLRGCAHMRLMSKAGRPYEVARLIGHNIVAFDIPRLRALMERGGVGFWKGCWWYPLDTYQRAIWWFTERGITPLNYQLGTIASYFGIEVPVAHEALADVRTCVKVTRALLERQT